MPLRWRRPCGGTTYQSLLNSSIRYSPEFIILLSNSKSICKMKMCLNFSPTIVKRNMKLNLFSDNVYFEEEDATSNVPARVPSCYNATPLVDRYQVGRRYACFRILAYYR